MKENILWLLEQASSVALEEGMKWYPDANKWAAFKAGQYDLDLEVVAAIMSALSPRNEWTRNLHDTDNLLMCYERGDHDPAFVNAATFKKNVMRAWIVRDKQDPTIVMTSPKTCSFVGNITYPHGPDVTVDTWAYRIAEGNLKLKARSLPKSRYEKYAEAYREAAQETGLRPCEVQAITWVEARQRVKTDKSMKKAGMAQLRLF